MSEMFYSRRVGRGRISYSTRGYVRYSRGRLRAEFGPWHAVALALGMLWAWTQV